MKFDRLRAKSGDGSHPSEFLAQHLKDVYDAGLKILDATGDDQLHTLGLAPDRFCERFRRIVLLAAAVHDLGKANDHFQGMITRKRNVLQNPQGVRHEWVTVLMLKNLGQWLLSAVDGSEMDFAIVEWAVAGHHPAYNHSSPPRTCPAGAGAEIRLLFGHREFAAIPIWLQTTFSLSGEAPATSEVRRTLVGSSNVFEELTKWARDARRIWEDMNRQNRRLVAAVKNCLIAADVAGSALPRKISDDAKRWEWISDSFRATPRPGELQTVVDDRAKTFTERDEHREHFQAAVAASTTPVSFVKAGCGSGKTQAAYMWAAKNHPTRRLCFCYPTTGTATEGFRDYLHEPNVRADLFHSRRDVDFEIILGTGNDSGDAAIRIDSLDAWSTPIIACTVDTVLGIVQNNKRGLFAWPALAQSAFVFDEIHAYDDRLFGALLRFLRDLPNLPVLLMTASLPLARAEALRQTLTRFRGLDLNTIPGPESLEILPRYHKLSVGNNDPLPEIQKALDNNGQKNGKVLWVCNTVGRVMDAADRAKGFQPKIYHSRFKYEDRVERHKAVIAAFKGEGAALAVCSQVAEMSLDLSADLLVTDLATVPAIIQRLGRLNRRAKTKDNPTKPFVMIEPDTHLPYSPADLDAVRAWLGKLPDENINQRHLAEKWEQTAENPPDLVPSAWLDGGPTTTVTELREASLGITVLMEKDVALVQMNPKLLGRHVLPMPPPPRTLDWQSWKQFRGLPIAPPDAIGASDYDPMRGGKWADPKVK